MTATRATARPRSENCNIHAHGLVLIDAGAPAVPRFCGLITLDTQELEQMYRVSNGVAIEARIVVFALTILPCPFL